VVHVTVHPLLPPLIDNYNKLKSTQQENTEEQDLQQDELMEEKNENENVEIMTIH